MAKQSDLSLPYNVQAVKAAKARGVDAEGKGGIQTEYSIAGQRGLKLVIMPSGTATFMFAYAIGEGRHRRRNKISLGRRDALTLADAKARADELRSQVEKGIDPVAVAVQRDAALTFKELCEKRLTEDRDIADSTRKLYRESLTQNFYKPFDGKLACDITAADVARVLTTIEDRGAPVHADRSKTAVGGVYKWARKKWPDLYPNDPTAGLGRRSPSVERERVLSDAELSTLWRSIDDDKAPLSQSIRFILKLAMLTGKRRSEVAGARRTELRLDADEPVWIIPGDKRVKGGKVLVRGRSKSGEEQVVRLSSQAVALFREALRYIPADADVIFPAQPNTDGAVTRTPHVNGESVSKAMRRLRDFAKIEDVTTHDLRRTCATWLGNQAVHPVVIELVLAHAGEGVTRKHYMHADMAKQVRQALQAWADHIWRITGQAEAAPSNVVPLRAIA